MVRTLFRPVWAETQARVNSVARLACFKPRWLISLGWGGCFFGRLGAGNWAYCFFNLACFGLCFGLKFLTAAARAVLKRLPPALDSPLKLKVLSPTICLLQLLP